MLKNFRWMLGALIVVIAFCLTSLTSCVEEVQKVGVTSHTGADPKGLNPYIVSDATARKICERIFQPLLNIDYQSYDLIPILAKSLPKVEKTGDGSTMEFEIRDEAVWDNGEPITGKDVAFSLKALKVPKVDSRALRPYFEYIVDVVVNEENPKKFTMVCDKPYMLQVSSLTDLLIYPSYVYDAEGVLENFTVRQLSEGGAELEDNLELIKFAESFNSPKFQREIVVGSGPYRFDTWQTNQRVVLTLKEDWYGNDVPNGNSWLQAYPKTLTYETINDPTTAVTALRGGSVDVMSRITPRVFVEDLKKSESFNEKFNPSTPIQFLYSYIGLNMRNPKLSDVKTRQAMTHLMDVQAVTDNIFYGMAEPVSTFVHPSRKRFINENIPYTEFNIEKAKTLLAEAGWEDKNADGVLEKTIEGEEVPFVLDFIYPSAAEQTTGKAVLMFKEAAKKVGITINPIGLEFSKFLDLLKKHDFDMYYGIWVSSPYESDPTQIWHTKSQKGGSNYVSFGDAKSDQLIDELKRELDEEKRIDKYKKLQQMIYEQAPYIFLNSTKNRVALHKRFIDAKSSGMNPGYFLPGLMELEAVEQ